MSSVKVPNHYFMCNEQDNSSAAGLLTFCIVASCCSSVLGVRLKFQIHNDFHIDRNEVLFRSCEDVKEVDRSVLELYGHLNNLGPSVRFWSSAIVSMKIKYFESFKVAGLNGHTIADIFDVLRKDGCFPFLLGGSVRDQLLDQTPNDVDVAVECTLARLMKICIENWGMYNCHNFKNSQVAHIGNISIDRDLETLDLGTTDSTFYVPTYKLEYTSNALAFDGNRNGVIIDLTGTGVRDACLKIIRIPSSDDSIMSWKMWLDNTEGVLYRYWKLRVKGLHAFSKSTETFIIENTKKEILAAPHSFPSFYCHYVFRSKYNCRRNKCVVPVEKCESGLVAAAQYNYVLSQDLGDFWTGVVLPYYLPNLEDCVKQN